MELDGALVSLACRIAREYHEGQVDKAGNPYIDHVMAVGAMLRAHGPMAEAAGYLHDVVEDGVRVEADGTSRRMTLDVLRQMLPEAVVSAVDAVTRRQGESYRASIHRAAQNPLGRLVKLADIRHNTDPARLALLDENVRARLEKRYDDARKILEGYAQ